MLSFLDPEVREGREHRKVSLSRILQQKADQDDVSEFNS